MGRTLPEIHREESGVKMIGELLGIAYIDEDADGALPRGVRVIKIGSEDGDGHPDGSRGKILGSVSDPEQGIAYFVEWDDSPRVPVLVIAHKIAAEQ